MGLAERFKEKLNTNDIFSNNKSSDRDVSYVSTAIKHNVIKPIGNELIQNTNMERYSLEDIETQIINKIRQTPYWSEFTTSKKEKMISSYLDKKINKQQKLTSSAKNEFISNIISLSNIKTILP